MSGVSASGTVGNILMGTRLVAITGCEAMGQVGDIGKFYWSLIDDSQSPNWLVVNNGQTPNWSVIDDSQTPNWQNVEMTV